MDKNIFRTQDSEIQGSTCLSLEGICAATPQKSPAQAHTCTQGQMAEASALATLQEVIKCPICLDDLRQPITTECGHNFCSSCIKETWTYAERSFPCPVCRHQCKQRLITINTQLGRMVSTVRLLQPKSEAERQGESPRCEKHSQILTLFCEEDLEVLCHQCAQLPDHEGHHVRPITEAAADHRGRIQSYTQPLRRQVADLQKQLAIQERELLGLSEKVKSSRQQVSSEYESVSLLLRNTEEVVLSRLDEDEDDLQHQHNASMTDISDHISALNRLLTELAEKIVMPEVELLAAIKGTLNMYGNLKPPEPCSFRVRVPEAIIPLSYPAMQKFREDITLDPETAHPKVYLFEDKRHAIFMKRKQSVPPNPKRFEIYPAVLGSEAFNSGRHYWEVQVGSKTRWAVGVCTESLPRSVKQSQAEQNGCWTIQLHHGNYVACGTEPVTLLLKEKPRGIGVYLDCDLGEISFYNLSDRSYIHSFMYNFPEVLKPYFYVGRDSKPLGVCQVTMTDKC